MTRQPFIQNNPIFKKSAIFILIFIFILAGCGSPNEQSVQPNESIAEESPNNSDITDNGFPRVISIDGNEITIPKKPERIAAISLDSAEAALELASPDRMAVVPISATDSSLAFRTQEAETVENKIAGATSLDPEQVLSYNADLLIMTKIHDQEKDASNILQQSGIPIIALNAWSTIEATMNNILIIGEAVGEDAKAEAIVADMSEKLKKIEQSIGDAPKPSVLVVSPVGPGTGPYLLGSSNISYDIVRLAGAVHATDSLGLTRTTQASIEQIIKADPEYILLVEWQEGNSDYFNEITDTPGWSTLQAVQNNQVKHMPARKLLNPNRYSVDHLEEIAQWLHPDSF